MIRAARVELVARRALDDRPQALVGLAWYRNAHAWAESLAAAFGLPVETVVGVVAALSPLNGWDSQLEWTPRILRAWAWDLADRSTAVETAAEWIPGPGLGANKRKAARILCGESPLDVLGGSKVRAFYANIRGDETAVCVDRHAWAIATGDVAGDVSITAKRYRETVAAFTCAAANLRAAFPALSDVLTPAGVQALTWVWWRDNTGDRF